MTQSPLYPDASVLLIDDERPLLRSFENILRNEGYESVMTCSDSRDVSEILARQKFSVILLDLNMPHVTGSELLPSIRIAQPRAVVIIVTATNELTTAVDCIKSGAFDYLVKPVTQPDLARAVTHAQNMHAVYAENDALRSKLLLQDLDRPEAFARMITGDRSMMALFRYAETIAPSPHPVLITGETGTGKELMAQAIHRVSRRPGRLVCVNAAGLDDQMFSDTLFGHAPGAFTGAEQARSGLIESAQQGTLFLDEIGDASLKTQVSLLRLLETGEYFPLGSDQPRQAAVRFIFATNRDLNHLLNVKALREDLYFRLISHRIHLPPLRERRGDIALLVEHLVDETAAAMNRKRPAIPPELIHHLSAHTFPGNIRELRAIVLDAMARHTKGVMSIESFMSQIAPGNDAAVTSHGLAGAGGAQLFRYVDPLPSLDATTDALYREAMRRVDGNQGAAAKLLGVSRRTLNRHFQRSSTEDR